MNIRFLSAILICLIGFQANSQTWTNYTTNEVFVDSVINVVHIDKRKTIWVGTKNDGLLRFNGFDWSKFKNANKDFGKDIRSISSEANAVNAKWIASYGFGLIKYSDTITVNWTFYEYDSTATNDIVSSLVIEGDNYSFVKSKGLLSNNINCVIVADQNQKWVGTNGKGVSRFKGNAPPYTWWTYNTNSGLANDTVNAIAHEVQNNMKWVATNGGLCRFDGTNWFKYNGSGMFKFYPDSAIKWQLADAALVLNEKIIKSVVVDVNRKKWIATNNGVYSFDTVFTHYTTANYSELISNSINNITIDNLNNKVFSSNYGVSIFNDNTASWTKLNSTNGLPSNNVICSTTDNNGIRWFGTNNGLAAYDSTSWVYFRNLSILKNSNIWSSAIDNNNDKWFGTYGNGVIKFNGSTWTNYNKNNGLADSIVISIAVDKSNNKWFGTYQQGLFKYNGSSFTNYNQFGGLASNTVFALDVDNSGNVWAGTGFGSGVSLISNGSIRNYSHHNGLAFDDVHAVIVDSQGNKWFGTYGGGLSKFNGTSWITYDTFDGLCDNYIQALSFDPSGNLWIATRNGISSFDGTTFTNYLPGDNIWDINVDEDGFVWVASWGDGIKKFDGNTWKSFTTKWTNKSSTLGLFDNRVNTILNDNGVKYFGTWSGLTVLNDGGKKTYTIKHEEPEYAVNEITNINIYPIPASIELTVVYNPINTENCVVEVYDVIGKQVSSEQILSSKTVLSVHNLDNGIYMLKITDGDSKYIQKIVKN